MVRAAVAPGGRLHPVRTGLARQLDRCPDLVVGQQLHLEDGLAFCTAVVGHLRERRAAGLRSGPATSVPEELAVEHAESFAAAVAEELGPPLELLDDVTGVATVNINGSSTREIQIEPDVAKLRARRIGVDQLLAARCDAVIEALAD